MVLHLLVSGFGHRREPLGKRLLGRWLLLLRVQKVFELRLLLSLFIYVLSQVLVLLHVLHVWHRSHLNHFGFRRVVVGAPKV